ncbi:hypothetical protein HF086_015217 [Spodoptera exigua]|uniref:Uncharacterized protein n=1 Tax=Spodoptera exigua TaxID=7107 RepID=A0A922SKW9_SPOEX|nr:hypothetical protein HF086_015217 [Spodoptera exigua]
MDCEEDPSRPKRQRKQLFTIMHDSDIEEVLFSDNSEDDYQPGDEESASESEGEEHPLDIELRSPARQSVTYSSGSRPAAKLTICIRHSRSSPAEPTICSRLNR